uniref:CRAL-TRIO domain-containing protein n=1 Tax=Timema genevievae TaxID=629358 RepID=A0A7R9K8A7_TIMGE|nr:unnamed protein product [Timema genevievae]
MDAIPVKLKAIHVINVNPVMSHIMNIIKPFIRKEHMKKLHLHSGGADFLKGWLPTENLPGDYGGVEEDFLTLHEHTMKRLEIYREWFEEEEKLKVDESKRPTDGTNFSGNIFGAEGSFKKLDID